MHTQRRSPWAAGATALALVAALTTVPLAAQEAAPDDDDAGADTLASVGDRIRVVTSLSPEPTVGWIDASDGSGLRLVDERHHEVRLVPREEVRTLELSRTRRSSAERAAPGMVAGGLAGALLGAALTEEHSCRSEALFCFDFGSEKLYGALLGASAGVLVGGLVSAAIVPAESWMDARLPRLTVATAGPRTTTVALVVPFPARRHR